LLLCVLVNVTALCEAGRKSSRYLHAIPTHTAPGMFW
jgi:hypothetical protein